MSATHAIAAALLVLLLAPASAGAATLQVAPGGSGAACTTLAPCGTLNAGYQRAQPGDTVEVAAGRYPSQTLAAKATAAAPAVVIRPALGARVIVGTAGATSNCVGFDGASHVEVVGIETTYVMVTDSAGALAPSQCGVGIGRGGAHHVTLRGSDVGAVWVGADDVNVIDNDIGPQVNQGGTPTAVAYDGIDDSERVLFERNLIHDYTHAGNNHQQCMAAWSGRDVTFRGNQWNNCETFHLWISASTGFTVGPYTVEGDTFTQTKSSIHGSAALKLGDKGGTLDDVDIRDNRVLTDDIYPYQGAEGGSGDARIVGNEVTTALSIQGVSCMGEEATVQRGATSYVCGGNFLTGPPTPPYAPECAPECDERIAALEARVAAFVAWLAGAPA